MPLKPWFVLPVFLLPVARPQASEERDVRDALDAFHRAASEADAERYFGAFAPEGVFMGTDPTERWTVEAFREWAKPYFAGDSAWIFVPRSRHVGLSPDRTVAWFDEILDSESYGECRGTGVLRKIGDRWKIAHYSLTIPVPNDLAKDLVRRIRGEPVGETVVFLVRHAEKKIEAGQSDPDLTPAGRRRAAQLARILRDTHLDAILATQYRRTQQTIMPIARVTGIEPTIIEARDVAAVAREISARSAGRHVLVCGHSNTLPAILARLGVETEVVIEDDDYDDLFVVTCPPGGPPTLLDLHY